MMLWIHRVECPRCDVGYLCEDGRLLDEARQRYCREFFKRESERDLRQYYSDSEEEEAESVAATEVIVISSDDDE